MKWSGYSIPINEKTVNLQLLAYQGEDLADTSLPNHEGYCKRLVYEDYAVKIEVHLEHKREPQIWSLEQLTNKQSELRTQNPELRTKDNVSSSSEKTLIPLKNIRRDGGTQPRANLNHQTVLEYVEDMKNGDIFPPVTVFYDGTDFWLCDGFHRLEAAFGVGLTEIAAVVKQGTRRDAVLYSVGANAKHGLRRTNADKRRAVNTLLEDSEWSQWSNVAIAKRCGVSESFVRKIKKESHFAQNEVTTYRTKHGTTTIMNTANIGKGKQTESPPAQDEVIPDSEQLNQDIKVTNPDENTSTNEAVDTAQTDEVNNYDDTAIDIEDVQADSKPKQSQRQRKGKQRLVNPLSIGNKVKVKENHYFGGIEGVVTQLATPYTVIVAFDNDEIEEKKPESTSFRNKSSQREFLPPDVEIKDSNKKTYSINIGRDTLMKIKKYIEGKPIYTAENAINLLLPDYRK